MEGCSVNVAAMRRRALLMDDGGTRVERAELPVLKTEAEDSGTSAPGVESERRSRVHERPYAAHIECPVCEALLDARGSSLRSLCCEGCGHLLTCEEVMTLREREHARTSRYL